MYSVSSAINVWNNRSGTRLCVEEVREGRLVPDQRRYQVLDECGDMSEEKCDELGEHLASRSD
jgi:hypothetical protein